MNRVDEFKKITGEMLSLYERKNHDYGSSITDTYEKFGLISFVVRLNDKLNRLNTLCKSDSLVKDENIRDTLIDLANYSVLAIIEEDLHKN